MKSESFSFPVRRAAVTAAAAFLAVTTAAAADAPILFNRPLQSNPRPHWRRRVRAAERAHTA